MIFQIKRDAKVHVAYKQCQSWFCGQFSFCLSPSISSTFSATTKDHICWSISGRQFVLAVLDPLNSSRSAPTRPKPKHEFAHTSYSLPKSVLMTCFTHLKPTSFVLHKAGAQSAHPLGWAFPYWRIYQSPSFFYSCRGIWATPIECHSWTFFFCWVHNLCRMTKVTCCVLSFSCWCKKEFFLLLAIDCFFLTTIFGSFA